MLRAMSRLGLVALGVGVIALAACRDAEVDRLGAIKAKVCACTSSQCADAAVKEVGAHAVASTRQTRRLAAEMLACVAKQHDKDRPADEPAP